MGGKKHTFSQGGGKDSHPSSRGGFSRKYRKREKKGPVSQESGGKDLPHQTKEKEERDRSQRVLTGEEEKHFFFFKGGDVVRISNPYFSSPGRKGTYFQNLFRECLKPAFEGKGKGSYPLWGKRGKKSRLSDKAGVKSEREKKHSLVKRKIWDVPWGKRRGKPALTKKRPLLPGGES